MNNIETACLDTNFIGRYSIIKKYQKKSRNKPNLYDIGKAEGLITDILYNHPRRTIIGGFRYNKERSIVNDFLKLKMDRRIEIFTELFLYNGDLREYICEQFLKVYCVSILRNTWMMFMKTNPLFIGNLPLPMKCELKFLIFCLKWTGLKKYMNLDKSIKNMITITFLLIKLIFLISEIKCIPFRKMI